MERASPLLILRLLRNGELAVALGGQPPKLQVRHIAASRVRDVDNPGEQVVEQNLRVVHYLLDLADRTLGEIA